MSRNSHKLKQNTGRTIKPSRRLNLEALESRMLLTGLTVDLHADSDSGVSSNDRITNTPRPVFEFNTIETGTLELDLDGDGQPDASQEITEPGMYSITSPRQLQDGAHQIRAFLVNDGIIDHESNLHIEIDTTSPHIVPGQPVYSESRTQHTFRLSESIDADSVSSANFTFSNLESNDSVAVISTTVSDDRVEIEFESIDTGTYAISYDGIIRDLAGNELELTRDIIDRFQVVPSAVWITEDQTLAPTNSALDGQDVVVDGAILTLSGHHSFENLWLVNGATVTHEHLDISGLQIQVVENLIVDVTSHISADEAGYLGGFDGSPDGTGPGSGRGGFGISVRNTGAGHGGAGGDVGNSDGGAVYGSVFEPMLPGSGGGYNDYYNGGYGGSGGGVIRLDVAGELRVDGRVTAHGGNAHSVAGGGSGGSIWVTTKKLSGIGSFGANGGQGNQSSGGGGAGRIAVYYDGTSLSDINSSSVTAGSGGTNPGGNGTIAFINQSMPDGKLTVIQRLALSRDFVLDGFGEIVVEPDAVLILEGRSQLVADTIVVKQGGHISADGTGFMGGFDGNPDGEGPGGTSGGSGPGGAGHASPGGIGFFQDGGSSYGLVVAPDQMGSGGGYNDYYNGGQGGSGGGAIRLIARDSLVLDGLITANGSNGSQHAAGGSGGSIWVTTSSLIGHGAFQADGGTGGVGGGGSGGRIAIYATDMTNHTGQLDTSATGGTGHRNGGDGSISYPDALGYDEFVVEADQSIFFDLLSVSGADVAFTLLDPEGTPLFFSAAAPGSHDDGDFGPIELQEPGSYKIVGSSHEAGSDYQFQIWNVPEVLERSLDLGTSTTASIDIAGAVHGWTFTVEQNRSVALDVHRVTGDEQKLDLTLQDSQGLVIHSTTSESEDPDSGDWGFTILEAGTYTLTVDPQGDDTAAYQFELLGAGPPQITNSGVHGVVPGTADSLQLFFNQGMDTSSFDLSDIQDLRGPEGPITADGFEWLDARTLEISFPVVSAHGNVSAIIHPTIQSPIGENLDQDLDGVTGEVDDDAFRMDSVYQTIALNQRVLDGLYNQVSVNRYAFSGEAGQQVRFDLLSASHEGIQFDLTGPSNWTGFESLGDSSQLITLPRTGEYVISVSTSQALENETYEFRMEQTSTHEIGSDGTYSGDISFSGQAQLIRIELDDDSTLQIELDDASLANHNELFVQQGTPPTRGHHQYRFPNTASPDQKISIPRATAGIWYILVYTDLASESSGYQLTTTTADIVVDSISPDQFNTSTETVMNIKGAGFDSSVTVSLIDSDGNEYPGAIQLHSYDSVTVQFDAGDVPVGSYHVHVSRDDGSMLEVTDGVQFSEAAEGKLKTTILPMDALGYHQLATIYVEYENVGNASMSAPLLTLGVRQAGRELAKMTLDHSRLEHAFWSKGTPEGFTRSVQFLASGSSAGILQPGEKMRVPIYWIGWDGPRPRVSEPFELSLTSVTTQSNAVIDWDALQDQMKPHSTNDQAWDPIWVNFVTNVGPTWGDYVEALTDNSQYLARLGQTVTDVQELLAFELDQANGILPIESLITETDVDQHTSDLSLIFNRDYRGVEINDRYKISDLGRGWTHNWQWRLEVEGDGSVKVHDSSGERYSFRPDIRSSLTAIYLSQNEDGAKLTRLNNGEQGLMMLGEPDGLLRVFDATAGHLLYVQDTNGTVIKADYESGKLSRLTHGSERLLFDPTYTSNRSISLTYNQTGQLDQVIDQFGRTTQYNYSGEYLTSVIGSDQLVTSYEYNTAGAAASLHGLRKLTRPGNVSLHFEYDEQGRLDAQYVGQNHERVDYEYDTTGRITVTNAGDESSRVFVDHRELVVRVDNDLGYSTSIDVTDDFKNVSVTDNEGVSGSYSIDEDSLQVTDALGQTVQFDLLTNPAHWTPSGPLGTSTLIDSYVDPNQNSTNYDYPDTTGFNKQFDLVRTVTNPDQTIENWTYAHDTNPDGFGDVSNWTNRRGQLTEYRYDDDGRIVSKHLPDGTRVDLTYDARGNLETVTDVRGVTRYSYDANDYLVGIENPSGSSLTYSYDVAGRRASMTDHLGNTQAYEYDSLGRLLRLRDGGANLIVEYSYDSTGRLFIELKGNGTYTNYEYNQAGQTTRIVNYGPSDDVQSQFDYRYDASGRRIGMSTVDGEWSYGYDDIDQLVRAVFDSSNPDIDDQDLHYEYDSNGNRISTTTNGEVVAYVTNEMNQYEVVGDTNYSYDDDGNLIGKDDGTQSWSYEYNADNLLTKATTPDGTWEYEYDAFGVRIATIHNGQRTEFLIDPFGFGNVVGEFDANGDVVAHYTHGVGLVSQSDALGSLSWYEFDATGSTSSMTDSSGNVISEYAYDPFGADLKKVEQGTNSFEFVGRWGIMNDESGLESMRARYYDSETGVFTSEDPIGLDGDGINFRRYVTNNPVMYIDPAGLASQSATPNPWVEIAGQALVNLLPQIYEDAKAGIKNIWNWWNTNPDGTYCFDGQCRRADSAIGNSRERGSIRVPGSGPLSNPDTVFYPVLECQDADPLACRIDVRPVEAIDPNELSGPDGYGDENYIPADTTIPYQIDFENYETATAPAQVVTISNLLSDDLDWSTFELTELVFGNEIVEVPAGRQYFETTISTVGHNGADIEVRIEAGLRPAIGEVYAIYQTTDPETSLPPEVTTGFLPPEDGTGRGQGHMSYLIEPVAGLGSGTEIRNIANITFDFAETIATNQVDPLEPGKGLDPNKEALVTLDAGRPQSSVISATQNDGSTDVLVQWNGTDDPGGSGVRSYDIYVSQGGGGFEIWLDDATETSGTFAGTEGLSYQFYSVASDNVGAAELAEKTAEATLTVQEVPIDIIVNDFSSFALPGSNAAIEYEIQGAATDPFVITIYASTDTNWSSDDVEVASTNVTDSSLLERGVHSMDLSELPELSATLVDSARSFLVAVVDGDNNLKETNELNNSDYFTGINHHDRKLIIRGGENADRIRVRSESNSTSVEFNEHHMVLDHILDLVLVNGNGGRDDIRAQGVSLPLEIDGGAGNDILVGGEGHDTIRGGLGGDVINGGGGHDLLQGDPETAGSRDIINGQSGDDTLFGGYGKDRLVGMAGSDLIFGGVDNDGLIGRDGNDTLNGDDGNDVLVGGRNNDSLQGGQGNDKLLGVSGNDQMIGGLGSDTLRGGRGDDHLDGADSLHDDDIIDHIFGESGFDILMGTLDPTDRIVMRQIEDDHRSR